MLDMVRTQIVDFLMHRLISNSELSCPGFELHCLLVVSLSKPLELYTPEEAMALVSMTEKLLIVVDVIVYYNTDFCNFFLQYSEYRHSLLGWNPTGTE